MTANNRHEAETARVRLARIDVEEGLNPRQRTDEQADAALAESVRAHGLLQPLVVTAGPDGRYTLIAGHRRYHAARAAGLAEVAVLVRERSENALELAVIENLQRSDLDPLSEAGGFERLMSAEKLNQTELAKRLSIPRKRVSERLRLLRLPEPVQKRFAAGELRGACAAVLERIAKVSPEVAGACAEAAAGDEGAAELLERDPGRVVAGVADDPDGPPLISLHGYGGHLLEELPLPAEGVEDIHRRYAALATDGRAPVRIALGHDDSDAARAYGCLLEFAQDRYWTQQFVCDPAFIADRVRLALDRIEARRREQDVDAERRHAPHAPARADGEAPGAIDMREARRQEREHEQDERSAARGANLDLGRALMEAFEAPKLSKDLAQLVSALVLGHDSSALAARGLRYVREDWQTVELRELKSGEQRRRSATPSPTPPKRDWLSGSSRRRPPSRCSAASSRRSPPPTWPTRRAWRSPSAPATRCPAPTATASARACPSSSNGSRRPTCRGDSPSNSANASAFAATVPQCVTGGRPRWRWPLRSTP